MWVLRTLDAFSDHACVFLCVSMHLEAELLTHEEIPTQCKMATQEWMATEYNQASDTWMANRLNMLGNPTAHRTQPSLPASQALAPCARQPGRARYKPFFSLQSLRCTSQDMRSEKHCTSPPFVHATHVCAQRTSLRSSDSPDKAKRLLSPPN